MYGLYSVEGAFLKHVLRSELQTHNEDRCKGAQSWVQTRVHSVKDETGLSWGEGVGARCSSSADAGMNNTEYRAGRVLKAGESANNSKGGEGGHDSTVRGRTYWAGTTRMGLKNRAPFSGGMAHIPHRICGKSRG